MASHLLFGLGFVAVAEGLMLALAPGHLRKMLEAIEGLQPDARRIVGLSAVAVGVFLVWVARI